MALSGTLRAQLYDVTPHDAETAALVSGIVACVALLACFVPAMRAARVDPVDALRTQ
jgi:ABC-type lipoprotein release transport system permease subunit